VIFKNFRQKIWRKWHMIFYSKWRDADPYICTPQCQDLSINLFFFPGCMYWCDHSVLT
jgi:hypothetical protein